MLLPLRVRRVHRQIKRLFDFHGTIVAYVRSLDLPTSEKGLTLRGWYTRRAANP